MNPVLVVLATPLFFLAMLLDWVGCQRAGIRAYRLMATLSDLASGCGQQVLTLFFMSIAMATYDGIASHAALHIQPSLLSWAGLFLLDDLLFYLFHRASHRVGLLWASHAVHHQSEDYNLAVALRQAWFAPLFGLPFFLPLSLLGFPTAMVVTVRTLNTLYQFWIHTRAVKSLGPLEGILNTPAHHRVHHGRNPEYLDSNYGGILILWDRLFSTFVREQHEPHYGTVTPLRSWNAAWANLNEWLHLWRKLSQAQRIRDKLWSLLAPPEWEPGRSTSRAHAVPGTALCPTQPALRYDHRPAPLVQAYSVIQVLLAIALTDGLLIYRSRIDTGLVLSGAVFVLATVATLGAWCDGRRWGPWGEALRLLVLLLALQQL